MLRAVQALQRSVLAAARAGALARLLCPRSLPAGPAGATRAQGPAEADPEATRLEGLQDGRLDAKHDAPRAGGARPPQPRSRPCAHGSARGCAPEGDCGPRPPQVSTWLLYYRKELRGVPLETLLRRKQERAAAEVAAPADATVSPATGTTRQSVI